MPWPRPQPLRSGSFSGCTAISVGMPKPRVYSTRTSEPGPLGAIITTVMSRRTCMPSSTMLKPCEYQSEGALLHQRQERGDHRRVLLVGRQQLPTTSAVGISSLVRANLEAVVGRVAIARALLADGLFAQGVADVEPAVAQVQTLIEALRSGAPTMTIFLPRRTPTPSVNSLLSMKRHTRQAA